MLKSLRIRNLATIEEVVVSFEKGFSILTGETGAGKSIIIDGIKLVLGEKASAEMVRTGKSEALIEAVFEKPEGGGADDNPMFDGEDEILIQRHVPLEGSGKIYVNGVLMPLRKLKDAAPDLVDVYGQNDHVFLLHLENHLDYLDLFLDDPELRRETAAAATELKDLVARKNDLEQRQRERQQRLDFLNFQIDEIDQAGLKSGEWEELITEREILRNAGKVADLTEKALDIAYLQEESVLPLIARLRASLAELGRFDPQIKGWNDALGPLEITLRETIDNLIKTKDRQAEAPDRLEKLEERLDVIEKLKRKYGNSVEDVLALLNKIREEKDRLSASEDLLSELKTGIEEKFKRYADRAARLSRMRIAAAKRLETRIEEEIGLLGMKRARFHIRIETPPSSALRPEDAREQGMDDVEFLISPNPGEDLKPLRKIASGGELSRIMLAIKAVGKEKDRGKTLIFDEIDAGIGGKTADFIAQKLKSLADRHQVLCITHLPQIASSASHHFHIDKKIDRDRTFTTVKTLKFEERVQEISRLLSGSRITETSLRNAREMLEHNLADESPARRK